MKKLSFLIVAIAAISSSGCLSSRVMKSVVQAGDKNVTLVQTFDTYSIMALWPVWATHQFWTCSETPGEMNCAKVCNTKGSDLVCPPLAPNVNAGSNAVQ